MLEIVLLYGVFAGSAGCGRRLPIGHSVANTPSFREPANLEELTW